MYHTKNLKGALFFYFFENNLSKLGVSEINIYELFSIKLYNKSFNYLQQH